jgi:glyoxylase-like metal-dependent hydrolase (beta-lactamase superfamily II)
VSDSTARVIDTMHQGLDRVIGVWERNGALIDPGPASSIGTVLAALDGGEPEAILLTHIHLDHAGATGTLVSRFPSLRVYVHEVGAPHLIDPSRLLKSAARLYGDDMERLWGEVLPVPEENLTVLAGGERIEGLRVIYTPGHASHHVSYLDEDSGDAFVGDVGGVLIPPTGEVWIPTPPPDIELELWASSIAAIRDFGPERLALTHFGPAGDPLEHLDAAERELRTLGESARVSERDEFLAGLEARIDEQPGEAAERIRSAMPPDQVWLGLERYWRKRDERAS